MCSDCFVVERSVVCEKGGASSSRKSPLVSEKLKMLFMEGKWERGKNGRRRVVIPAH